MQPKLIEGGYANHHLKCRIAILSQNSFGTAGAEAADDEPPPEPGGAAEGAQHGARAHLHRRPIHPLPERQDCAGRVRGPGLQETAGSKMFTWTSFSLCPHHTQTSSSVP